MNAPTLSLLTIAEAARRSKIAERTLRHACAAGLLPAVRVGQRSWLLREKDLDFFSDNRPKSGPKPKRNKGLAKTKKSSQAG